MKELWLSYTDLDGAAQEIRVEGERFTIGRLSSCGLSIPDARLSREHLLIERFDDAFFVSDLRSSNGSSINGSPLGENASLRDGDLLDLGGVQIVASIRDAVAGERPAADARSAEPDVPAAAPVLAAAPTQDAGGFPVSLIIVPMLGLITVVFAGGIFLLLSGSSRPSVNLRDDGRSADSLEDPLADTDRTPRPGVTASPSVIGTDPQVNSGTGPTPLANSTPGTGPSPSGESGELAKVEHNSALFLRRIAQNDPKAFITADQAKRLAAKIRQISGNPALAANIAAAGKNASQLESIARSKGLKTQFLAVAAINKLGNTRGDVVQTAQGLLEVLDKLSTQLGTEQADEALLIIAAYEQGVAGDFLKMRNMLEKLSNKYPESTRAIRTIWFLEKNQLLSAGDFDRALTFLAIGAITQNPRDFGVNAEALVI